MANQIIIGHFTPDGDDVYIPLGFKPDYFELTELGASDVLVHRFFGMQEDDEASGADEGVKDDGDGTRSKCSAGQGFAAYDTGSQGPTVTTWTKTVGDNATARSATAHGTYVKPSITSDTDREAVFECVTAGTSAATEPTWPAAIGEQVTDGTTVWERVNVPLIRIGYQGVLIPGELQTNGQEMYYIAIQADRITDHGDVDGWSGGVYGA